MYKTYYEPDQAYNFFARRPGIEAIRVHSIGHSTPWPGYRTAIMERTCYVWHFLKSGSILYRGEVAYGPCSFLMIPGKNQYYEVCEDTPSADQYWIIFSGTAVEDLLHSAGMPPENHVLPCPYIDRVWTIFERLTNPEQTADRDGSLLLVSALLELLSLQAHHIQTNPKKKQFSPYVKKLVDYIEENYSKPLNESMLAAEVNLSVNYMHRCFCKEVGMPPIRYLNKIRIRYAKLLLSKSQYSIAEIAESTGFANGNYLCRVFQKHNDGLSPGEFRRIDNTKTRMIIKQTSSSQKKHTAKTK